MDEKIYTTDGFGNGWGNLFGAGFGGFLGAALGNGGLFGNRGCGAGASVAASDAGAAATISAVNSATDSISRQMLAGQQESQLMASIGGVNSRIDGLGAQIASNQSQAQVANGFNGVNANIGDLAANVNSFARDMQNCCCQAKTAILEQGYQNQLANCQQTNTVQAGFANIGYLIQQQGERIMANDAANTQKILDWLCNSKQLEQATTIQQLRDEVGRLNQTQNIIAALKTTTAAA